VAGYSAIENIEQCDVRCAVSVTRGSGVVLAVGVPGTVAAGLTVVIVRRRHVVVVGLAPSREVRRLDVACPRAREPRAPPAHVNAVPRATTRATSLPVRRHAREIAVGHAHLHATASRERDGVVPATARRETDAVDHARVASETDAVALAPRAVSDREMPMIVSLQVRLATEVTARETDHAAHISLRAASRGAQAHAAREKDRQARQVAAAAARQQELTVVAVHRRVAHVLQSVNKSH